MNTLHLNMEALLNRYAEKFNTHLDKKESKWYNGQGYLPLIVYTLSFEVKDKSFIHFKYEHRQSAFSKNTSIDGGAFVDRHLYEIDCKYLNKHLPAFEIKMPSWFSKVFNNNTNFTIICSDLIFKEQLMQSTSLKEIFKIAIKDPEFDPLFKCTNEELKIYFNTKQCNEALISSIFSFLIAL